MPASVKEMLAAANASVAKISPQDAAGLIGGGNVLIVDVRDGRSCRRPERCRGQRMSRAG
jgi:hypothetical protein